MPETQAWIDRYITGRDLLADAYRGLEEDILHRVPEDGSWTLHQIAVHIMDSDMIASDRMKRVASMDRPLLVGFDESAFAKLPGANLIRIDDAIELFQRNRAATTLFLQNLPETSFDRVGVHNEAGELSLQTLLQFYTEHVEHHLRFVDKKKKMFLA